MNFHKSSNQTKQVSQFSRQKSKVDPVQVTISKPSTIRQHWKPKSEVLFDNYMNSDDLAVNGLTDNKVLKQNDRAGMFYVKNIRSRPTHLQFLSKHNTHVSYVSGQADKHVNQVRRPRETSNHLSHVVTSEPMLFSNYSNKQCVSSFNQLSKNDKFNVHDCVMMFDECIPVSIRSAKPIFKPIKYVKPKGSTFKWVPKGSKLT